MDEQNWPEMPLLGGRQGPTAALVRSLPRRTAPSGTKPAAAAGGLLLVVAIAVGMVRFHGKKTTLPEEGNGSFLTAPANLPGLRMQPVRISPSPQSASLLQLAQANRGGLLPEAAAPPPAAVQESAPAPSAQARQTWEAALLQSAPHPAKSGDGSRAKTAPRLKLMADITGGVTPTGLGLGKGFGVGPVRAPQAPPAKPRAPGPSGL